MRCRGFFGLSGAALYLVVGLVVALAMSWAGAGLSIWYLDGQVKSAEERAREAVAAKAAEEESRKGFQAAAGACSASVTRLAKAGADRDKLWADQLTASSAKREAAESQAAAILTAGRPEGMTECEAMKRELDAEVDRRAAR